MKMKWLFPVLTLLILLSACTPKPRVPVITFQPLQTGVDAEIRALQVINEKVVWAAASQGTVLLSVDGGENWKISHIEGEEQNEFRSLHAWDAQRALVVGIQNPARFYRTEDGGDSWQVVYEVDQQGLFFNSMKFADDQHGLALSDPIDGRFYVVKTTDGGRTWSRIENLPPVEKGEANFAASNTCIEYLPSGEAWFVTGGLVARVFKSLDHGENWTVVDAPVIAGHPSSGIYSVAFHTQTNGVMVGGTYDHPEANTDVAAWSTDGGVTWQLADIMPGAFRSCVQVFEKDDGHLYLAMGKTGCDYSLDKGQNWTPVPCEGYYTLRAVPGQMKGYAAGSKGRIARVSIE